MPGEWKRWSSAPGRPDARGLIIPDLVYGRDEGLYELGGKHGVPVVPVITPSVPPERLQELLALTPEWIYTALRSGITGAYTELDETNLSLLDTLKPKDAKVMAGFGIKSPEQVRLLAPHCDAVVVGSAIVRAVTEARKEGGSVREAARDTVRRLSELTRDRRKPVLFPIISVFIFLSSFSIYTTVHFCANNKHGLLCYINEKI